MKKSILVFLILFNLNNNGFAQENELEFLRKIPLKNHFNTEDFNGGIQSWTIDQDTLGIIYIANNQGLLEFDGNRWNTYPVPQTTRLRAVKVTSTNKIFVGGQGQIGYFERKNNDLVYHSLNGLLPKDKPKIAETWKIIEHKDKIYFNTESEIYVYDYNSITALKLPGYMRYIYQVNNRLFAQFYGMNLFEIERGNFKEIKGSNLPYDIVTILPIMDNLYLLTREGEVYNLKSNRTRKIPLKTNLGTINTAIVLNSNEIAIGTQSNGLFIFDQQFNLKRNLTKNQGLSDRTVKDLYEDNFNNLWVALNNGIDYLKLSLPFSLINEELGIEGTGYNGIMYDSKVYLGTNNGAFVENTNRDQILPFTFIPESDGQVYSFSNLGSDLFLNHNKGLFEINNQQLTQIYDIGNWNVLKTDAPNIMVGHGYRGISFYKRKNNTWERFKTIDNFDENLGILEFENNHTLWASHVSKGIFKISINKDFNLTKKIEKFDDTNGLPSKYNNNIYPLNKKLVYTTEKGVYEYDATKNSFEPNSFLNEFTGEALISGINATSDAIYYMKNHEVEEIKQISFGNFQKRASIFKHINHLINDDLSNISVLNEKNILFGAKEGFILYNPDKQFKVPADFKTIIKGIEISKENDSTSTKYFDNGNTIKFSRNHTIKVRVASPYFDGFESLKYSYKLEPNQSQWSNWSSINSKEYSHLPPGEYTLNIKALNIYENESSISTISFTVLTPWYLRNWAKLIYIVLFLFILTLIPLWQRFHFKKEKSDLQEKKAIALQIKDQEINKLENEKLKTEIDSKNDQLTTITMQLVKNNEFIQTIQKDILNSLENNSTKSVLKKISKNIDNELSKDHSWDEFAYHFDQVHGNYLKKLSENNIKLSPREIKLAAFLRMNMSSKEIAVMLNITLRGVELARYRLRKKLNLTREQNLVEYLISLDNK